MVPARFVLSQKQTENTETSILLKSKETERSEQLNNKDVKNRVKEFKKTAMAREMGTLLNESLMSNGYSAFVL